MSVIDTLQILVEADARGIEQTMKKVIQTATSAVDAINKQEVDWTSIFSRSVTPAIVASVASMFAFAIEQSLQFQQALNTTGVAAGESTQQIAQMGQSALALSEQVPSSAQDIANAMAQVSSVFGNTADQQAVVSAMAKLAASGFGSLNDIVAASLDIFKQWGVTTTTQAIDVLTSLMHGAQGAKESIPALAAQFSSFTPQLITAGLKLSNFNEVLAGFSAEIKDVGATSAKQVFTDLANGASQADSPVAILGGGVEAIKKSLIDNGGLSAVQKLSTVFSAEFGNNVGLIATKLGFSYQSIEGIINAGKQFPALAKDTADIAKATQSIGDAFDESDSGLRELTLLWQHFKAEFTDTNGLFTPLISGFAKLANSALTAFDEVRKNASDALSSSPLFGGTYNPFTFFSGDKSSQVNGLLQGTGVGFSDSSLKRIDQTASQSGLVDSLIEALQSGVKGQGSNYFNSTFHLNVPSGATGLTAKMIADQLYKQFSGTSQ